MSKLKLASTEGFTLVELLASLTVLALLGLMVLAGVGDRSVAWAKMEGDTARGETVEAIQALLYDRIQHVWPVTLYNILPPGPDFEGDETSMVFLAPPAQAAGPGPLRRYRLSLASGGDLVLDLRSDVALDQDHWSSRQVLLHDVQAISLAYFGPVLHDNTPDWRLRWSEQPALPSLVRVRVDFPTGDRRRWPDLLIHPMADVDAACLLQATTGRCKGR